MLHVATGLLLIWLRCPFYNSSSFRFHEKAGPCQGRNSSFGWFFLSPGCRPTGGPHRPGLRCLFFLERFLLLHPSFRSLRQQAVPSATIRDPRVALRFGSPSQQLVVASRPASIRTLVEPLPARCQLGSLVLVGRCHLCGGLVLDLGAERSLPLIDGYAARCYWAATDLASMPFLQLLLFPLVSTDLALKGVV